MGNVVVTGIGAICSIGDNISEIHKSLQYSKCGLNNLSNLITNYSNVLKFGEVKHPTTELQSILKIEDKGVTRTSLLALHALKEAISDSKLTESDLQDSKTALIVGNTVGGMCLTDELYNDANANNIGSQYLSSYDCGSVTLFLQKYFKTGGTCDTINTACSSAANAIIFGARLIKNGYAKRAIVGGVDSLAKFTINGFNSLGILAPDYCKPFDKNRNGLNLGEGAGFLILEDKSFVTNKYKYCVITGYHNSNDAFHPSALSDSCTGPFLSMSNSLKMANITPNEISFVNCHGTGTENNDEIESKSLLKIFNTVPPFISSKSKIGHTLGASAAIESVFSIISLKNQEIYPSLNFNEPIEDTKLSPNTMYKKHKLNNIMLNSFAFGGNCCSIIYSKI